MKTTDQSLLEQMRITELEVDYRKALYFFTEADVRSLRSCGPMIENNVDSLVERFYELQTSIREIALVIGDADTLARLRSAQRRYVLDLFSGEYDLEYVNNRLRIGLVHKRIGVEPKLYLSAIHTLTALLRETIVNAFGSDAERQPVLTALDKLIFIDVTLVFETYIRSLVAEIETAKDKAEEYARTMEVKVKERTQQLEELSRIDALTGLLNVRHMDELVTRSLRSAQRRAEPVTVVYLDINNFKVINDTQGHQRGDEVLRTIGAAIMSISRIDDNCFRYGGDEFCVVLSNCRAEDAQERFVARIEEKIKTSLDSVSLSVGVAQTGPNEYANARELIHLADQKMYAAKKLMKGKVRLARA
jgi:diguanylate cyclase (GGDEF)-like protein